MTGLARRTYDAAELDPLTGPVPAYANPGAVEAPGDLLRTNRSCPCGVEWRSEDEADPCWACREVPDAVA